MNTTNATQSVSKVANELKKLVREAQAENLDGVKPSFKSQLQHKDLMVLFLKSALITLEDKQSVLLLAGGFSDYAEEIIREDNLSLNNFRLPSLIDYACMEVFGERSCPYFHGYKNISQKNKDEVVKAISLYKKLYGEKTGFAIDCIMNIVSELRDEQYFAKTNAPDFFEQFEAYQYYVACEFLKLHKEGLLVRIK